MDKITYLSRVTLLTLLMSGLLVACGDDDDAVCNDDGVCDVADGEGHLNCPGDCPLCNNDGTCDEAFGETLANCPADCTPDPCDYDSVCDPGEDENNCPSDCPPDPCDYDTVCDPGEDENNCPLDCPAGPCNGNSLCETALGETEFNCSDCGASCNPSSHTGALHEFVVSEVYLPGTSYEASENGVDLDGDGDIDNKLGQVIQLLTSMGLDDDPNQMLNQEIAVGSMLLLARMHESGASDGVISMRTMRGTPPLSPPLFDGTDTLLIDPTSPTDQIACGSWSTPVLSTDYARLYLPLPLPVAGVGSPEYAFYGLHSARIQTVTDPTSAYFAASAATSSGWTEVMVGGGLTQDQVLNEVLPDLQSQIAIIIAAGGAEADTIADLFDGNCVVLSDVPQCANVVAGSGACDDSADPPVITLTELQCNALLHSALSPDVDTDGDGYDDLLSFGYRIVSAVPATLN